MSSSVIATESMSRPTRSPGKCQARLTVPKRVYGRRRTFAPRPVLEHDNTDDRTTKKDPAAGAENSLDNLIKNIQETLATIDLRGGESDHSVSSCQQRRNPESDKRLDNREGGHKQWEQENKEALEQVVGVPVFSPEHERQHMNGKTANLNAVSLVKERRQKSGKTQRPRRSSGCVEDAKANVYTRPILDQALSPISSRGVRKFSSWARRAGDMFDVVKIAEGSYGDVYQLRLKEDLSRRNLSKSRYLKLRAYDDGIFKIIPIRAQSGAGSRKFTSVTEIVSEVKLLKLVDSIPGFARFRDVHVVQGRFPEAYQVAWEKYSIRNDDCINPDPSNNKSYPDSQLWAILEMENAGFELEKFAWTSMFQVYDIFWGVALALARAEQFASFEHRDLHLGNICIKPTRGGSHFPDPHHLTKDEIEQSNGFGLSGIEITIIDYSLSRAELQPTEIGAESPGIAWTDLDKKKIFDAIGRDEDERLLRDTYRYMRSQVYNNHPLHPRQPPDIPGQWKCYNPKTNLTWLLFLLTMLLRNRKRGLVCPEARQPLGPRSIPNFQKIDSSAESKSGSQTQKSIKFAASASIRSRRQKENTLILETERELSERLQLVLQLLDLKGEENLTCAGDLVAFAIGLQWLDERDFLC